MLNKSTLKSAALYCSLLIVPTFSFAATECVTKETIKSIDYGNIQEIEDPNSGNAVVVTFEGKSIPTHNNYNSDDDKGKVIIDGLNMAFSLGLAVTIYDESNGTCESFDRLSVYSSE